MMAARLLDGWVGVLTVVMVFGVLTISTMVVLVALGFLSMRAAASRIDWMDRHVDVLAGSAIAASAAAVLFLGV